MKKFALTSDQLEARTNFINWLSVKNQNQPFILTGNAGSGKTFLALNLMKLVDERNLCWTFVAPTHKALEVIKETFEKDSIVPTWYPSTLHRLLRLKLKRKGDAELFEKTPETDKSLQYLGLVLVDEASMVGSHLLELLLESSQLSNTRIVFLGDPAQLPPVGESISPVFKINRSSKSHLKEVVRHSGPVLQLASMIREDSFSCKPPPAFSLKDNKKGFVRSLESKEWLSKAKQALRRASEKDDPDSARILCFTNRFLERLIPHARSAIHGDMASQMSVLPGEILMSRKAIMSSAALDSSAEEEEPGVIFGSNTEMLVKDVRSESFDFSAQLDVPIPAISTLVASVLSGKKELSIRLLPEVGSPSRKIYNDVLENLSNSAKNSSRANARPIWRAFFYLRDAFAFVGPAAVLTVHRSQGSTFNEVFVASDIFWPKNIFLRRQLTYVAITRASKGVWLQCNEPSFAKKNAVSEWQKIIK